MSSLYKRATPRQAVVLRMIEGAVRNAAHAHPGRTIDDERIARSIAKRATGTLVAGWPSVLAAPRVRSEGSSGDGSHRSATDPHSYDGDRNATVSAVNHDRRGASQLLWRAPLRVLQRAISHECGNARKAGNTARYEALVDVLRLISELLDQPEMPDPRTKLTMGKKS